MDRDPESSERCTPRSNSEVAITWIDYETRHSGVHQPARGDPAWWAVAAMMDLPKHDPVRALEICFEIAKSTDHEWALVMLGAGPLEDLLSDDPTLLDAVAHEAGNSPTLLLALRNVWQSTIPDDVWNRLQKLVADQ